MKRWQLVLLAATGGALVALAIPNEFFPFGNPALGWMALAPFYVALASSPGYGFSALLGAVYGAVAHGLSSYWLWYFKDFAIWTLGSTVVTYALIYAHLALWLAFILRRGGVCRSLAFALLWAGFEFLKSSGFLGYPWGLVAYSVNTLLPLIQIADRTGVYGLSFLLAWSGAALGEVVGSRSSSLSETPAAPPLRALFPRPLPAARIDRVALGVGNLALVALAASLTLVYGYARLARPVPEKGRFTAVFVQQNADSWTDGEERTLRSCMRLTRKAIAEAGRKPDIVLWNESNLDAPYKEFQRKYSRFPAKDPLIPFFQETGTRFFMGAPVLLDWDTLSFMNSVILVGPDASLEAHYGKIHLVPFAEVIPFLEYPWFREFMEKVVGLSGGGWTPGTERVLFPLPASDGNTYRFAGPICFEDAFADLCREFARAGADFYINLTNDSWSRTVSAETQHLVAARFRAVENRRTLVRSTNGGVSCVVGPYGEIRESLPLFKVESRFLEVPVYREKSETVYTVYGDWFAYSALFLSALFASILVIGDPNRRKRGEHTGIPCKRTLLRDPEV